MTNDQIRIRGLNLDKANAARLARSEVKKRLKSGELNPAEVVFDPPDYIAKTTTEEFLCWLPRVGPDRAGRALRRLQPLVTPRSTLGCLGPRSQTALVDAISLLLPRVAA